MAKRAPCAVLDGQAGSLRIKKNVFLFFVFCFFGPVGSGPLRGTEGIMVLSTISHDKATSIYIPR